MPGGKKLTKLAKIGMSHNDRAKAMAAKGMYSEALSELKIALFSLRSENRDGTLNDDIAGVLNSIGSVNLLLKDTPTRPRHSPRPLPSGDRCTTTLR